MEICAKWFMVLGLITKRAMDLEKFKFKFMRRNQSLCELWKHTKEINVTLIPQLLDPYIKAVPGCICVHSFIHSVSIYQVPPISQAMCHLRNT